MTILPAAGPLHARGFLLWYARSSLVTASKFLPASGSLHARGFRVWYSTPNLAATQYDVVTAVQQFFLTQAQLHAIVSDGKLHHKSAPEDTLLPYATYFKVSDTPDTWTTAGPVRRAAVQLNIHHSTDAEAQAIAETFASTMNSIVQQAAIPIVIYGRNAMHVLPGELSIDVGEGLAPGGLDCWIASVVFDIPYTK